jgi:Lyase
MCVHVCVQDTVCDRDFVAEYMWWSSLTLTHLSQLAEDLIIMNYAKVTTSDTTIPTAAINTIHSTASECTTSTTCSTADGARVLQAHARTDMHTCSHVDIRVSAATQYYVLQLLTLIAVAAAAVVVGV